LIDWQSENEAATSSLFNCIYVYACNGILIYVVDPFIRLTTLTANEMNLETYSSWMSLPVLFWT